MDYRSLLTKYMKHVAEEGPIVAHLERPDYITPEEWQELALLADEARTGNDELRRFRDSFEFPGDDP